MVNDTDLILDDISNELLIFNKLTIDTLFKLENCDDCIALYVFYYKTAKWQKTDTIKANDLYVQKTLKWGTKKIRDTKKTLKENGLIEIIQRREKNKIAGWYIRVSYLISQKKGQIIVLDDSKNAQKQQVDGATSSFQETNALKEYIKCLKKEIEMLKYNNNNNNKENLFELIENNFGRTLASLEIEEISMWEDTELTRYAIKQAVLKGICNIKYISKILYEYQKNNVKTVQQAQQREKEYEERRKNAFNRNYQNLENQKKETSKWDEIRKRVEEEKRNERR